jgi:Cytochrome c oxidase subunit IV
VPEHEEHIHLPPPSIWPMTTAAGVALAGLGAVTLWPFTAAGLLIMAAGIIYWVQELRNEPH